MKKVGKILAITASVGALAGCGEKEPTKVPPATYEPISVPKGSEDLGKQRIKAETTVEDFEGSYVDDFEEPYTETYYPVARSFLVKSSKVGEVSCGGIRVAGYTSPNRKSVTPAGDKKSQVDCVFDHLGNSEVYAEDVEKMENLDIRVIG